MVISVVVMCEWGATVSANKQQWPTVTSKPLILLHNGKMGSISWTWCLQSCSELQPILQVLKMCATENTVCNGIQICFVSVGFILFPSLGFCI